MGTEAQHENDPGDDREPYDPEALGPESLEQEPLDGDPPEGQKPPEERESLWWLAASPLLWLAHFLASYLTAAIWCAKVGAEHDPIGPVRVAILVYTLLALGGIVAIGFFRGLRPHELGTATVPHDFDTMADRHRFLGFAVLLLSGLSFVAVVYVALPAVFYGSCR